ncbi:MAG: site-specific integrase, partial [Pseudomonadota bacterium]|nr:site-specific integrase [Pseudomonadota bacterium]
MKREFGTPLAQWSQDMGAIRKRGNSFHAQVRIKGWQSFTKTFPTKSLAKRWIEKTEAQLREHPVRNETGDDVTLADACTRYMNEITHKHKGYASESARLNFLARGVLGNIGLRYLSTAQINAYFQMRATEVKEGTLRKEFILLRQLFTVAISTWNLSIPENPMAHLPVPKDSSNRERRVTLDEWNKIITIATQMRNPLVKAVVIFAYETGMRRSEILRLRRDDIDGNICTIRNTKNGSDRIIPLSRKA